MPGPYDYSNYSDQQRDYFRSFMTPERWTGLAQYGMGQDVNPVTYEQLVQGQSIGDEDRNFLKEFLAEIMRQQGAKRGNVPPGKTALGPAGEDPEITSAKDVGGSQYLNY